MQPGAERLGEQPLGARLGQHLEQRIDPRFDRPLAQEVGAEAVDRADVRFLEALDRIRQAARGLRHRLPAGATFPAPA